MISNKCLIIMPAYNEENTIKNIIYNIKNEIRNSDNELLVIDDGSTDKTARFISEIGCEYINNVSKSGVSFCYKLGIEYASVNGFKYVLFIDSDGQHDPSYLTEFINQLCNDTVLIGNRFSSKVLDIIPTSKISSNYFASRIYSDLTGLPLIDISCGYKAFPLSAISYINEEDSYDLVYDLVMNAILKSFKIKYVNMEPIYFISKIWCTPILEIKSLINCALKFASDQDLIKMLLEIKGSIGKTYINIIYRDIEFYFHKVNDMDYLIQTDISNVREYFIRREVEFHEK